MPDIIVIGGGPAGMMAAGRAASLGADVWLLERNPAPGRKLLLTGQGRCNVTNDRDAKRFIADCGPKARFLHGALARFSNRETVDLFEGLGVGLKLERGGRYFPESDRAGDVLDALLVFMRRGGVRVLCGRRAEAAERTSEGFAVRAGSERFLSERLVIATGGMSYPATGSTGDGYRLASALGHSVVQPLPTDVPMMVREGWVREMQGLSLRNVELNFGQGKKRASYFGEMLFTHYGISGPIVLDASRTVGPWLANGPVGCVLDLKPALDAEKLDERLRRDVAAQGRKSYRSFLKGLMPYTMIPVFAELSGVTPAQPSSQMTVLQRRGIGRLLKGMEFTVTGLRGFEEAVATAGGVETSGVDPRTMSSRKTPGLFLCGEVLDLDGPCGGYNLQIAWSTGHLAGTSAAEK